MKSLLHLGIIVIIIVVGVLIYQSIKKGEEVSPEEEISMPEKVLETPEGKPLVSNGAGKKIAMIIAFRDFRDEEYLIPKQTLAGAGAQITTVSTSLGKAIGVQGGEAEVNLLIDDLKVGDYDAILFIGGPGAHKYIDDSKAHQIAQEVVEANKVLGAICIAPAILARAGVLAGKKATVWSSTMDKSMVKVLEEEGANYLADPVVVDGKIVTANGPAAARSFAETIIQVCEKEMIMSG